MALSHLMEYYVNNLHSTTEFVCLAHMDTWKPGISQRNLGKPNQSSSSAYRTIWKEKDFAKQFQSTVNSENYQNINRNNKRVEQQTEELLELSLFSDEDDDLSASKTNHVNDNAITMTESTQG